MEATGNHNFSGRVLEVQNEVKSSPPRWLRFPLSQPLTRSEYLAMISRVLRQPPPNPHYVLPEGVTWLGIHPDHEEFNAAPTEPTHNTRTQDVLSQIRDISESLSMLTVTDGDPLAESPTTYQYVVCLLYPYSFSVSPFQS